jgi:hypothetical protein
MSAEEENEVWRLRLVDASDKDLADHYYKVGSIGMDAKQSERAIKFVRNSGEGALAYPVGRRGELTCIQYPDIADILISPSRRPINDRVVEDLVQSIRRVGLLHPPIVCFRDNIEIDGETVDGVPVLVAGRHRLEAWRRLGHYIIPCVRIDVDQIGAELIEISENLHRADLTALQRDEQVARWIELTKAKQEVSSQVATKPNGRPEGGVNAAARELGISKDDAHRAVKVAGLSTEAKLAAVDAGLDNNRSILIAAAKAAEPAKQVETIKASVRMVPALDSGEREGMKLREAARYAAFMAAVAEVEPLLVELEYRGYPEESDEQGDPVFSYSRLSFIQIADRYKTILGFSTSPSSGKGSDAAWRRVGRAKDTVFRILCGAAGAEITVPSSTPDTFTPIARTPTGQTWEREEAA